MRGYSAQVGIRVLLVDDVVEVRHLVRTALRLHSGFEVVGEAGDGSEAVRLAEQLRPDVVVLDLGLPDIAGREVLTRIRERSPESRVVVFSGVDSPDRAWIADHVEGIVMKDGELDYLVKLLETVGAPHDAEASIDLPQAAMSARLARQFVADRVAAWRLEELLDDALLVTSELATNAVTHAGSACRIRLSVGPDALRIDVLDRGAGTPEPQPESRTAEHGRGLHLVDALTSAWGLEVLPGHGKLVWVELARP